MIRKTLYHRGMTLVELVVALALAALLMTALIGVLAGTQRELDTVRRQGEQDCRQLASSVLHRDLLAASMISSDGGWLWLDGVFSADARGERPRRVGYRCVEGFCEGESTLMRLADGHGEPVVIGPRKLLMERLDSSNVPQPISASPTSAPDRVRLWMWMPGEPDDAAGFIQDLVLH